MTKTDIIKGFSLVEILVSLFVVSLAAVNITGLQKMVGDQNRDNFTHSTVLKLATAKMEEVLQSKSVADIENLPAQCSIKNPCSVTDLLRLGWEVKSDAAGTNLRDVTLQIDWNDSRGEPQSYTYSEQVNLAQLLNPASQSVSEEAAIIESFLQTNDVIYFEPKMGYKRGSFVIYNSELFQTAGPDSVGNGHPRDVNNPTIVSDGWKSYGPIDNADLSNPELYPDLKTLFPDPVEPEVATQ